MVADLDDITLLYSRSSHTDNKSTNVLLVLPTCVLAKSGHVTSHPKVSREWCYTNPSTLLLYHLDFRGRNFLPRATQLRNGLLAAVIPGRHEFGYLQKARPSKSTAGYAPVAPLVSHRVVSGGDHLPSGGPYCPLPARLPRLF